MNTRVLWVVIGVLLVIIVVLSALLVFLPAPLREAPPATTASSSRENAAQPSPALRATGSTAPAPLSASVSVSSPQKNASVGETFMIEGVAPSGWYFEAVFPIKVVDANDNTIASAQGRAQSDWTAPGLIPFTASVTIDPPYHGPATLVILRDNPSGLPQNDDSLEVPILIR